MHRQQTTPQCFHCGKAIIGKYYLDWQGHALCDKHIKLVTHCASCGAFCNAKAKDIGAGYKVCSRCQKYRIEREEAQRIIDYIQHIYAHSELGRVMHWHLKMANAAALLKQTDDRNARGLAKAVGREYTIYIFRELSRVAFASVLAHEMLHVYQYTRHLTPPKPLCEGFCNLGSYVVLSSINNLEARAAIDGLRKNPDPVYGDGFRAMLALYEQGGWPRCIKELMK